MGLLGKLLGTDNVGLQDEIDPSNAKWQEAGKEDDAAALTTAPERKH